MPKDKAAKATKGLADPAKLNHLKNKPKDSNTGTAQPGDELLQVIIETPRGSRNKYSYDEKQRIFLLKATLPAGMVFPYDFGFVPRTVGGDGDPLDILVLMDEPCFPGCALLVRLLGVMEAEQMQNGKTNRNDRLVAVAETAQLYANFNTVDDIPETLRNEIAAFFDSYHRLQNKPSRTLSWKGPNKARKLIQQSKQQASEKANEEGKA